jgi:hypothetical protein
LKQIEFAFGVGFGTQDEVGVGGLELDFRAGDGPVLGIVDYAMDCGEYGGERGCASSQQKNR